MLKTMIPHGILSMAIWYLDNKVHLIYRCNTSVRLRRAGISSWRI